MPSDPPNSGKTAPSSDCAGDSTVPQPGRRNLLIKSSALLGASLLQGLAACGGGSDDATAAPLPTSPSAAQAGPPALQVDVGFRSVSTAVPLDSRYAGVSYEKD